MIETDDSLGPGMGRPSCVVILIHRFTSVYSGVRVTLSLALCVMFCNSVVIFPLYVLRFTDSDYPFAIFKLFFKH